MKVSSASKNRKEKSCQFICQFRLTLHLLIKKYKESDMKKKITFPTRLLRLQCDLEFRSLLCKAN